MVIAVTNRKLCKDDFPSRVKNLLLAKPFLVILREKDLTDFEYQSLAEKIIGKGEAYKKILSLNRPDIARKIGVKNVHLTFGDTLKGKKPEGFCNVGVSVHSVNEAYAAQNYGADYLIAGHIYKTDCKKDMEPRGLEFLKEVSKRVEIPVFAIGGINITNYKEPYEYGARGICLMSEFMTCKNPFETVKTYL